MYVVLLLSCAQLDMYTHFKVSVQLCLFTEHMFLSQCLTDRMEEYIRSCEIYANCQIREGLFFYNPSRSVYVYYLPLANKDCRPRTLLLTFCLPVFIYLCWGVPDIVQARFPHPRYILLPKRQAYGDLFEGVQVCI